ncbi:hypothetical protein [Mucilaginibacter sp. NFX135]|uniref:hypothetical protein n=1 Tax=Mucilaginibacter sp. NFX135 TaxID=3402687 RepID=UPI003AFA27F9
MKTIDQLTNVDKAKVMFDRFKNEIPDFLEYTQSMAERISRDKDELIANWNNPFLSFHQWLSLSEQVGVTAKRYGKSLAKRSNVFSEQLFGGYAAIFTNHCLEQYGLQHAKSQRFARAIQLFYLPEKQASPTDQQYLVLEMHGGAEYAAICTDADGNNLVFDNRPQAEAEAADCQDGLIVEL